MEKPKIAVIIGSIREGRLGEKVTRWFMEAVKNVTSVELELVDIKDYPLPLFADAETPSSRKGKHANPEVQKWLDKVDEADGYIIVTAEYDHGVPAALKNALEYPFKEWHDKPIGFVGYGNLAGGSRAVEQLRLVIAELGMYDVREQVLIPIAWKAFDEKGTLINGEMSAKIAVTMLEKVIRLAKQLQIAV